MTTFAIGTKVIDRDGVRGEIRNITKFDGSVWYDVRFRHGSSVRFPQELTVAEDQS